MYKSSTICKEQERYNYLVFKNTVAEECRFVLIQQVSSNIKRQTPPACTRRVHGTRLPPTRSLSAVANAAQDIHKEAKNMQTR